MTETTATNMAMSNDAVYRKKLREWFESSWKNNPALVPLNKDEYDKYICTITACAWESYLVGIAAGGRLAEEGKKP
jgi:hypothetical protein